jgi:undecaprenyl phosphate-alpha-L-ara4FN deformylase
LRGTFWPGSVIGDRLAPLVRLPREAGHEVGLHAWDHHSWQVNIDRYSVPAMLQQVRNGFNKLSDILGAAPTCSAAAGWRCNEQALALKEQFQFLYNSDCRGTHLFKPVVGGRTLAPQVPVTLPTYDEIIGSNGVDNANFNNYILDRCKPDQLNVYTIHAEVEGIALHQQFEQMLIDAQRRGIIFQPLGELLRQTDAALLPSDRIVKHVAPGREGWLAWQGSAQPADL